MRWSFNFVFGIQTHLLWSWWWIFNILKDIWASLVWTNTHKWVSRDKRPASTPHAGSTQLTGHTTGSGSRSAGLGLCTGVGGQREGATPDRKKPPFQIMSSYFAGWLTLFPTKRRSGKKSGGGVLKWGQWGYKLETMDGETRVPSTAPAHI